MKDLSKNMSANPLTVIRTSFKGISPRFFFAALFMVPSAVPKEFSEGEDSEIKFWISYDRKDFAVGTGATPGAAIRNLYSRQRARKAIK